MSEEKHFCDRPVSIRLCEKIELVIDEIASGKLTPIEVLGCLELVKLKFHDRITSNKLDRDEFYD